MTAAAPPTRPRTAAEVRTALGSALNDAALMATVIDRPTLVEAAAALLGAVGVSTCAASADTVGDVGTPERVTFLCGVIAGDEVGEATLGQAECALWVNPQRTPGISAGLADASHRGLRMRLVESAARCVTSGNMSVSEILADPMDDNRSAAAAFWAAIVGAWVQARLAEGHTVESARFLLRLTANPAMLARLQAARDSVGMVDVADMDPSVLDPASLSVAH